MQLTATIRYILIGLIVIIIGALAGWYFFIQAKQNEIAASDAGRGTGVTEESFGGRIGSTYENIVAALTATIVSDSVREGGTPISRLSQVNKSPVAGMGFVQASPPPDADGSAPALRLRFVERSTGYLLDADPETLSLTRLTNELIPRAYRALIGSDNRVIIHSTLETGAHEVVAAQISATSSEEGLHVLEQLSLPPNIRAITLNPSADELFLITGEGDFVGSKSAWDGSRREILFRSSIPGWNVRWLENGRIVVTQNAADGIPGYAYEIESGRTPEPLVRATPGLAVLPHPASSALMYSSANGTLSLFLRANENASDVLLPIRTIAEKCVWSPREQGVAYCAVPQTMPASGFIDRWYRGEEHTSDSWWRIDAASASAELLYAPGNATIDVDQSIMDDGGNYIAFINATDRSLWLLRVAE